MDLCIAAFRSGWNRLLCLPATPRRPLHRTSKQHFGLRATV